MALDHNTRSNSKPAEDSASASLRSWLFTSNGPGKASPSPVTRKKKTGKKQVGGLSAHQRPGTSPSPFIYENRQISSHSAELSLTHQLGLDQVLKRKSTSRSKKLSTNAIKRSAERLSRQRETVWLSVGAVQLSSQQAEFVNHYLDLIESKTSNPAHRSILVAQRPVPAGLLQKSPYGGKNIKEEIERTTYFKNKQGHMDIEFIESFPHHSPFPSTPVPHRPRCLPKDRRPETCDDPLRFFRHREGTIGRLLTPRVVSTPSSSTATT